MHDAKPDVSESVPRKRLPRWVFVLIGVYLAACAAGLGFLWMNADALFGTPASEQTTQEPTADAPQQIPDSTEVHASVAVMPHVAEVPVAQAAVPYKGLDKAAQSAGVAEFEQVVVEPTRQTFVFGGDVLLHRRPLDSGANGDGSYSYDHFFEQTADITREADVAAINQETMMAGASYGYQAENYTFNSPQSLADAEMDAGYDVILKAMNHAFDMGFGGLHDELVFWHDTYPDVPILGVADPYGDEDLPDRVHDIYIHEQDGLKVAILNYTYGTNSSPDEGSQWNYVALLYDQQKMADDIAEARDCGADFVIACPHWGIEYQTEPSDEETRLAQFYADQGVDVVVGGHPHVLQRADVLTGESGNTCLVYYSMGNYVASALDTRGVTGGFARFTLCRDEDGSLHVRDAEFLPTVTCDSYGKSLKPYFVWDWTDGLAATSSWPSYGRGAVDSHLHEVFGDSYDASAGIVHIDL